MQIEINEPILRITYIDGTARQWSIAIDEPNNSVSVTSDSGVTRTWTHEQWAADHLACLGELDLRQFVPATITATQARIALKGAGLLPTVQAMIDAQGEDSEIAIFWEYSITYGRRHPLLLQMASALNLSEDQVDALFRSAARVGM